MTCTSILAPAYALSHESILRSEIQKPLLQACYGRSWCWSLVQINCILYMIYYLHNNIKIEHFTSRWCVAAVVWQATRAYSWGWDTVIFRWKFESELVMTVFVISGVLWGRIFPQKKLFFFIYLTISTRKMHIPGLRMFSPYLHFSRCHLGMLHFDPYQSSEVPFFWWTIKIMYLKFTSNRAPRPP